MNYNTFRDIFNFQNSANIVENALIKSLGRGFSSDCNGVFGSDFEMSISDEINGLNLGVTCMTNKELDFYYSQKFVVDCSNYGSPNWSHLSVAIKDLFHPISVSDIYLVSVDYTTKTIKILDGLSVKTCVSKKGDSSAFLHNDANGDSWFVVDNLTNNRADPRSDQKIGNVLIVRGNSSNGTFETYFFDGTIGQIYNSFATPELAKNQNYVFSVSSQAIVVTNRKIKGTGTSFNRGIQLKKCAFTQLNNSKVISLVAAIKININTMRQAYMLNRFGF